MLSRTTVAEAATALAVEVAEVLHCHRVTIGLLEHDALRLVASSQPGSLDGRHAAAVAIRAAMHEMIDQRQSVAWPPPPPATVIALAHRQLAGTGEACTVPLVSNGTVIGGIALERVAGGRAWSDQLGLCEDVASFTGPVIDLGHHRRRAGAAVEPTQVAVDTLAGMKKMGVHFLLGEFGGARSSLLQLRWRLIDAVKIHRQFFQPGPRRDGRALVNGVLGLARRLGLLTIATGIDSQRHLNVIKAQQCDEYQGPLVGSPTMAAAFAERWLAA